MQAADVFEWLDGTYLAVSIRQSPWLFPAIEIVHIVGFIFLVGSAFLFDFVFQCRAETFSQDVANYVLPWSREVY
jgi:hypothetical protein